MQLISLHCPNCGANLEIEEGVDTFFCKYCGYKILLEGQSDAAYEARVRVKYMEHKERIMEKRNAQERYKMEFKQKDEKWALRLYLGILGVFAIGCLIMLVIGNTDTKKQEKKLQTIVDEIMIDIDNEDFANAYVKANELYWNDSWTSNDKDKWDATRKEIIKQIEEAEKKATGTTNHESEKEDKGGIFNWFK